MHQLVAFPRVSRLVLAAVWGSGGSPGAKVVGASGGKPGPLGDGTSVCAEMSVASASPPLRPANGRVFPGLLPAVGGQIQESVRRCHHFIATAGGPVSLEHTVPVPQVAYQRANPAPGEQGVGAVLHRVPGNGPAHEVAIARALLVRTFAERGVGDVAGMQVGQLVDVGGGEGAALALGAGGLISVPHVKVGDQKCSALKDLQ